MRLRSLSTWVFLSACVAGCSKFERLPAGGNITQVRIGSSRHRSLAAPQAGGVMVWGLSTTGNRVAVALNDETGTRGLALPNGEWTFFATGWTGTDRFQGVTRCAAKTVTLNGTATDLLLDLFTGICTNPNLGAHVASGSLLPLRITTCRSGPFASVSNGDSSVCSGTPNIGPFRAFKVSLNGYLPSAGQAKPTITESLTTGCKNNPSWGSGTASFDISSVQIPTGLAGGNSPIDTTIWAYTDPTCSTSPVEMRFPHGLADGTTFNTQLYSGTAPASASLFLLGPAPTVSSVSPASGSWAGGTWVTLTGTGFFANTAVTINGRTCTSPSISSTSYSCVTPNSLKGGAATVVVNNTLQSTTLPTSVPFSFTETPFGNAVDADLVGDTVTYNSGSSDWSSASTLGARVASASRNVQAITQNSTDADLTLRTSFTANDFAVNDEVLWHVSAAGSNSDCSTAGDLPVGKFGFGRVTVASSPTLRITGTISSSTVAANILATTRAAGTTFCVIQVVRVPNFRNLTFNASSGNVTITRNAFSFTNGHGGILPFRVAGALTYSGSFTAFVMLKGLGYPGGLGATLPFQGSGRFGSGLSNAAQLSQNDMGGAPGLSMGAGGGAGYGNGGDGGIVGTPTGKGIGVTTCLPSAGCALFGGGGGGGNAGSANGGAGGGIALLYASQITFSSFTGSALPWTGGQEGLGTAGSGSGAGAGGTTLVQTRDGTGVTMNVENGGGHAADGSNFGGGAGAGGLTETRECTGTAFSTVNAGVGSGNGGSGAVAAQDGHTADVGSFVRTQLASGVEFCP